MSSSIGPGELIVLSCVVLLLFGLPLLLAFVISQRFLSRRPKEPDGLQGLPVSPRPPADGDVLRWNSAAGMWEPGPLPGAIQRSDDSQTGIRSP